MRVHVFVALLPVYPLPTVQLNDAFAQHLLMLLCWLCCYVGCYVGCCRLATAPGTLGPIRACRQSTGEHTPSAAAAPAIAAGF